MNEKYELLLSILDPEHSNKVIEAGTIESKDHWECIIPVEVEKLPRFFKKVEAIENR